MLSKRFAAARVFVLGATTAALLLGLRLTLAHEGHDKAPTNSSDPDASKHVTPQVAKLIGLKTAEVDFGKVEEVVRLTGVVTALPDRFQAVAPRVGGIVSSIAVQAGDLVRKGQLVAEIDSPELARNWYEFRKLEAEQAKLESDLKRVQASVQSLDLEIVTAAQTADLAEAEAKRLKESGDAVSLNVLNERTAAALKLRTEAKLKDVDLARARQEVVSTQREIEAVARSAQALRNLVASAQGLAPPEPDSPDASASLLRLYAQIDGVVTSRSVVVGQGVEAGQTLLTVGEYSQVQIDGEVPESLVDQVQAVADAPVRISKSNGGQTIATGKVRFVSPAVDPVKRTAHVIAIADNPEGLLRQGAYVGLAVVVRQLDEAVVVPVSAVLKDGPLRYVFIKENDTYTRRLIEPGYVNDQVVEVNDGLVPGDVVAVQGAYSLSQLRGGLPDAHAKAEPSKPAGDGHGHSHD